MLIMSRIEFHLAHFSGFMNHGPSPTTTLDSYGTFKWVKKASVSGYLLAPYPLYLLLLLSLELGREDNPKITKYFVF